jgi:hypothetical protein
MAHYLLNKLGQVLSSLGVKAVHITDSYSFGHRKPVVCLS